MIFIILTKKKQLQIGSVQAPYQHNPTVHHPQQSYTATQAACQLHRLCRAVAFYYFFIPASRRYSYFSIGRVSSAYWSFFAICSETHPHTQPVVVSPIAQVRYITLLAHAASPATRKISRSYEVSSCGAMCHRSASIL